MSALVQYEIADRIATVTMDDGKVNARLGVAMTTPADRQT